ncbi:MAG: hypothetical protein DWQ19_09800 [Crenarchaeota archaeon]|nr:MAG: hypothetical protein DWQ19_09800 [Thermoproteota archaeon]
MSKKEYALNVVEDLVANYLFYDRKEDEDLSRDDMEQLKSSGELTIQEVVDRFKEALEKGWDV